MSRIVDIEPLLKKYDGMNEGTEFSPIHFINDLMALEQLLFTEKEELLRVGKGAVKARQGRFVIYDVEWLKKNFYSTEEKIYGQPKQPCEDAVSRAEAIDKLTKFYNMVLDDNGTKLNIRDIVGALERLPSVTPQASEEDIHREREQAYMLGYEDASKKFRTQPSEDCISILNRIMEYTYGMLTAEKYGLQHLIKSMMDDLSGGGEDGE